MAAKYPCIFPKGKNESTARACPERSEWECVCHPEGRKKGTNMKVSPTMLLIIKDLIFYPTMCMINKVLNSPIPRC
jgi:hypothetical protein